MKCRANSRRTAHALLLFFLLSPALADATSTQNRTSSFPLSPRIQKRVDFWTELFTKHSAHDVVIHDGRRVEKVYSVIQVSSTSTRRRRSSIENEKRRVRNLLLGLHKRRNHLDKLTAEERRIVDLWKDVADVNKFRIAAYRLRAQSGLQEQFERGIRTSNRYLPEMERIFASEGLPRELTRLPLIESCFDLRAYSHKRAAGVWQFMPSTGRLHGLRIDRTVDERRDPILATYAAARYLKEAYAQLGSWPLAITAYNHGTKGIARAVRTVGSADIADLIDRYRGRAFGFAGQNFYAEFLAALAIQRQPDRYFGPITLEQPRRTDLVRIDHYLSLEAAAQAAGVSEERLAEMNPALGHRIVKYNAYIPRGARLHVPAGKKDAFVVAVASWAKENKARLADASSHRVRPGETLSEIATDYGTSVALLQDYNGIHNARRLRVGQVLTIPDRRLGGRSSTVAAASSSASGGDLIHRVRRGETLSHIARRYGTSAQALQRHNGIRNSRRLRIGQMLAIPGKAGAVAAATSIESATPTRTADGTLEHTVRRGQTLTEIARAYGTSIDALQEHNEISDGRLLRAGQRLRIPDESSPAPSQSANADSEPEAVESPEETEPSEASQPLEHRVRRGQTLSLIAKRYGTTVGELKRYNGIRNSRRLQIGQIISIPSSHGEIVASVKTSEPRGYIRHTVQRGQTLSHIAKRYGTTVRELKRRNGIRDPRRLKPHQVIKVPD